ncbi:MAG: hypothetical protein ACRERD_13235 [Candidatus Binatia bacterium]
MKEAVIGVFDDFATAESTVRDLIDSGFPREEINLIVRDAEGKDAPRKVDVDDGSSVVAGAGAGAAFGGVFGLLVGLGTLAIPGIGPILVAGPLAATIAGSMVGGVTGLWLGGLSEESNVPQEDAGLYSEAVHRGATLVSLLAEDQVADRARDIMKRHGAIDIHQRAAQWSRSTQTDASANI